MLLRTIVRWDIGRPREIVAEWQTDIDSILARRNDNDTDFWATPDGRIYVGNPYSTISSLCMLHELGVGQDHEAVAGGVATIVEASRHDGRIRVAPKAPLYPCYTAEAARTLFTSLRRRGGRRCGRVLAQPLGDMPSDRAVPLGNRRTLQAGLVTRSFATTCSTTYTSCRSSGWHSKTNGSAAQSRRWKRSSTLTVSSWWSGRHRGLKRLTFCETGEPSSLATERYREIGHNLSG